MLVAALFSIAKNRKHPDIHQLVNESTKCGLSHNGHLSAVTEQSAGACQNIEASQKPCAKWRKPENTEENTEENTAYCMFPFIGQPHRGKDVETGSTSLLVWEWDEGADQEGV